MAGWGAVPQGLRAAGAAQALGKPQAPKAKAAPVGKPMRMPQQHNARPATRPPVAHHANPVQRPGPAHAGPQSWLEMNPAQLQHYATKQVQAETKTGLAPYQQKAGEITGTEQTVAKRFGGYGEATDKLLGGLQSGAEGSAKTYGNMAADAALKAQGSVAGVGTQTQTGNGNYLDPQVANTLKEQQANITGIGASRTAGAESQGQNEQGLLTNMRAAAAQRVTEGQGGIASQFGKQQAANQAGENALLARQPGAITKLNTELGQKQFTNRATEQGLGIKVGTLKVGQQNAQTKATDVVLKARGAKEGHELTGKKLGLEGEKFAFGKWAKKNELQIKNLSAGDKAKYDAAQTRYKEYLTKHGGKAPSPSEGRKYMSEVATIEAAVRAKLGPRAKGAEGWTHQAQEAIREELRAKNVNADRVNAALNLAVYGRLGPGDQATAISYGLTPELRPQWFKKG